MRLTYERLFAALFTALDFLYLGIVSKTAVEKAGDEFGRKPVGSGPDTLKDWKAGSTLLFARNPGYKNVRADVENKGAPYPDERQISIVKEEGTRMAALETGQLHMSWALFEEVPRIQKDARLQIIRRPKGVSYIFLEFNTKKPPFDKLALRRAIAYSVDSKEILDASYLDGTVIQAPLRWACRASPRRSAASTATGGTRRRPPRSSRRRAAKGADGKLRDGAGKTVKIMLTTWVAPQISRAAQVIQAQLQAAGVECELTQTDAAPSWPSCPKGKHDFDLMRTTFPDPNGLSRLVKSPGGGTTTATRSSIPCSTRRTRRWIPIGAWPCSRRSRARAGGRRDHPALQRRLHDRRAPGGAGLQDDGTGTPMYYDVWLKR